MTARAGGWTMGKWGVLAIALALSNPAVAQHAEPVDLDMVSKIRQEAFHRSQVMDTFSHLTESIGPRLTNSPAMSQANAWTRGKFNEWGLVTSTTKRSKISGAAGSSLRHRC